MIERSERDGVVILRLAHGKASLLDLELCLLLMQAIDRVAVPLVITGTGSIFSAGVDLVRLTSGGVEYVREFLPAMDRLFRRLLTHPRPIVAAINGHAIAGGCVIAAACDRRLMSSGRIGVPELAVGVPFPALPLEVMRWRLAPSAFQEAVVTAKTYEPAEALRFGLIDEVVAGEQLLDTAIAAAKAMASIPAATFELVKAQLRRPVMEAVERAAGYDAEVRRLWESPAILDAVRAYVAKTLKK